MSLPPLIIAGNGPSLAQIDYSRLPREFEVFRCNQFYFESHYFLGKKIKACFFNPCIFTHQIWTLHHLRQRGEYEVESIYCNALNELSEDFKNQFPYVQNSYSFLKQLHSFLELNCFFRLFHNQWPTSGIVMLITAIAQGYREIYLTGIDFYEGGGTDYAFEVKNKKLGEIDSNFNLENFTTKVHHREIDIAFLRLALSLPELKLYSLSPSSSLSQIIPLAPTQAFCKTFRLEGKACNSAIYTPPPHSSPLFEVLPKSEGYICDILEAPEPKNNRLSKIKKILSSNGLSGLKTNFFFILAKDFYIFLRAIWIVLKNFKKLL